MTPRLRTRLRVLELRQRGLGRNSCVIGPSDMDSATALRLLKYKGRPGDTVRYYARAQPGTKPQMKGRPDIISDAEWETLKDYPRRAV